MRFNSKPFTRFNSQNILKIHGIPVTNLAKGFNGSFKKGRFSKHSQDT